MAKDRLFFIISVACLGILAAVLFRKPQEESIPEEIKQKIIEESVTKKVVEVMVSQRQLNAGDQLQPTDFAWVEIKPEEIDPSMVVKDEKMEQWLKEAVVAKKVPKGDQVKRLDILWPNEQNIEPLMISTDFGNIGVPFELKNRSGIGEFLEAGKSVDIIFSSTADLGFNPITLTLLKDIRILGTGTNNNQPRDGMTKRGTLELLLEMTPREAEIFAFAQQMGEVSLGLIQEGYTLKRHNSELAELLFESHSVDDFYSTLVTQMIRSLFPQVDVRVTTAKDGYIVSGKVQDPQVAVKIREIIEKLTPEGEKKVVDLMEVQPQQVLICVKVFEVVKDASCRLGVNWSAIYENAGHLVALGSVFPPPPASDPNYFFDAKDVRIKNLSLNAIVDMLQTNGNGRVLAEPNLTTISGKPAHFFAGGEFPVLIPQGGTLAGTVTVEYRPFGVILDFTPTVGLNGLITLHVVPEISTIDPKNSVVLSGFEIPSLIVRRADTTVKLWPGQSYAIAGLLQYDNFAKLDHLYGLCRLPVIGPLFRSKKFQESRTEMVIIITPYLISSSDQDSYTAAACPSASDTCTQNSTSQGEDFCIQDSSYVSEQTQKTNNLRKNSYERKKKLRRY